jgi:hypothetical protein
MSAQPEAVAPPPPTGLSASWRTEAVLAGACVLLIAIMQLVALKTTAVDTRLGTPENDAYASLALRDVRAALDAERARSGHMPADLQTLVAQGWLTKNQITPGGLALHYQRSSNDSTATLTFADGTPERH